MTGKFDGFPPQTLEFLSNITANNNKAWFEANRDDYERYIKEPARQFVIALGARLQDLVPDINVDPRTNGSGNLLRFYRDTRFSKDKSPYKTNIAMWFWQGAGKKMERPGIGLQIEDSGCGVAAGVFGFTKPLLESYRQAVMDDQLGRKLVKVIALVRNSGAYTIEGEQYKRVPPGFDVDHPRSDWLKYGGLWASSPRIAPEIITSPDIVDVVVSHASIIAPIQQWIIEVESKIMG